MSGGEPSSVVVEWVVAAAFVIDAVVMSVLVNYLAGRGTPTKTASIILVASGAISLAVLWALSWTSIIRPLVALVTAAVALSAYVVAYRALQARTAGQK